MVFRSINRMVVVSGTIEQGPEAKKDNLGRELLSFWMRVSGDLYMIQFRGMMVHRAQNVVPGIRLFVQGSMFSKCFTGKDGMKHQVPLIVVFDFEVAD